MPVVAHHQAHLHVAAIQEDTEGYISGGTKAAGNPPQLSRLRWGVLALVTLLMPLVVFLMSQ